MNSADDRLLPLTEALSRLHTDLTADILHADDDLTYLTGVLLGLQAARHEVRQLEQQVEQELLKHVGRQPVVIDGVATLVARSGRDRKEWQHQLLAPVAFRAWMQANPADPETGEILDTHEAAARAFLELANPTWRVTALRPLGVDPDRYCTVTGGKTSLQVTKVDPQQETEAA